MSWASARLQEKLVQSQTQHAALQQAKADCERRLAEMQLQFKAQDDAIKSMYSKRRHRDAAVQSGEQQEASTMLRRQHAHHHTDNRENQPPSYAADVHMRLVQLQHLCAALFQALPVKEQSKFARECEQCLPSAAGKRSPVDIATRSSPQSIEAAAAPSDSPAAPSSLTSPGSDVEASLELPQQAPQATVTHHNAASDMISSTPNVMRRSLRATFGLQSGSASQFRDHEQGAVASAVATSSSMCALCNTWPLSCRAPSARFSTEVHKVATESAQSR